MSTTVKFYYDSYEKTFGDGFYPQLKSCESCKSTIDISFKLVWVQITRVMFKPIVFDSYMEVSRFNKDELEYDYNTSPSMFIQVWKQMNGHAIRGLDGNCGAELLSLLDDKPDSGLHTVGIADLYGVLLYHRHDSFMKKSFSKQADKSPEVEKAERVIEFHTAMPYILGGSVAKYQGMEETLAYLNKVHSDVMELIPIERVKEIIQKTIEKEST